MPSASSSSSIFARYFPKTQATYTRYSSSPVGRGVAWSLTKWRRISIGFSLAYVGGQYLILRRDAKKRDTIHPNTYLVWNFYPGSIVEVRGPTSLSYLLGTSSGGEDPPRIMELAEAIRALDFAANDPNIRGLVGDFTTLNWPSGGIQTEGLGLAQIEELMQAIYTFKVFKDKQFPRHEPKIAIADSDSESSSPSLSEPQPGAVSLRLKAGDATGTTNINNNLEDRSPYLPSTIAFTDTFASQSSYLLASAFEKIYLQPSGTVPLTGLGAQVPFFSRLLGKLGVKVRTEARREYKSMISTFQEKDGLPPLQAQDEAQLFGELNQSVAYTIGSNRFAGISSHEAADKIVQLMGKGPYSAKEAVELGLIDGLKYKGDVIKLLAAGQDHGGGLVEEVGKETSPIQIASDPASRNFKTLSHYSDILDQIKRKDDEIVQVAILYLRGTISAASGDFTASTVVKGLKEAARDEGVKAIVLRIDSGGGDVVASDSIWHAIQQVRESSNKPVIVSFGNIAASGGYYAATAANCILASETTITGSIGVAAIRPHITRKLFDWAGVGLQTFFTGSNSQSILHAMDDEQLRRQSQHIDDTYEDFLDKVVQGRRIDRNVIEGIAGGRVFTGLVAWMRTSHLPLELAERQRRMSPQRGVTGNEGLEKNSIGQMEEAVELYMPHPQAESAEIFKVGRRWGLLGSLLAGKRTDDLTEWDLQDMTGEGEMSTKLIVMKAKSAAPVGQREGLTESAEQGVDAVLDNVQDAVKGRASDTVSTSLPHSSETAEEAHRDAIIADASGQGNKDQDSAARHAQEAKATSSPYGAGLIDNIGGIWDAAILGMSMTIEKELEILMREQGLSREQAIQDLRPGCLRAVDAAKGITFLMPDIRLVRYPRERSFLERLKEINAKGEQPSLSLGGMWSTVQHEVGGMMARSFLAALGENPAAFLREVAKRVEMGVRKEEEELQRGGVKMEYGGSGLYARL